MGPDGYTLSDLGNAERFAAKWEGRVLYCDDQAQWWLYKAPVWYPDRKNELYRMAMEAIGDFRARITATNQPGQANLGNTTPDQWERHLKRWGETRNIRAMLELVKAIVPVLPEEFDATDNLLNALDGTIVLDKVTGEHYVREHTSDDLLTKVWQAHFRPDATHPDVDEYRATFLPETDRWEFIEEAMGYSLPGGPKRYAFQLLGPSNAGKSMFLRILNEGAGETSRGGYGATLDYHALRPDPHGGGGKHRTDLMDLRVARFLTISEVGGGNVWDGELYKTMLSGGDSWKGRGAYERRTQTFKFTLTMWTSGNKPYGASADDDAAYERTHVIKFEHPMPKEQRSDQREAEIVDPTRTGDAFLACWLRGFARLYGEKGGRLTPPDSVVRETARVRGALNPYTEMLVGDEGGMVEFTKSANDGVVAEELWTYAREQREIDLGTGRLNVGREKSQLEAAMVALGAVRANGRTRFRNRDYWRGVRWTKRFAAERRVTMPDWDQTKEANSEEAK